MQLWKCPDARYESRPLCAGEEPFPDRFRDSVIAASNEQLQLLGEPLANAPKARRFKTKARVQGSSARRTRVTRGVVGSSAVKNLPIGKRTRSQANQTSGSDAVGSVAKRVKQVGRKPVVKASSTRGGGKNVVDIQSESDEGTESEGVGSGDGDDDLSTGDFVVESPDAGEPQDPNPSESRHKVDPDRVDQVFVPSWSVKNGDMFDNLGMCRDMVDHVIPPSEVATLESKSDTMIAGEMNWVLLMATKIVGEGRRRWEDCHRQCRAEKEKSKKLVCEIASRDGKIEEMGQRLADLNAEEMLKLRRELEVVKKERDDATAVLEDVRASHRTEIELLKSSHVTELELEARVAEDSTRQMKELEVRLSQQVKQHQELQKKWELEKRSLTTVAASSVSERGGGNYNCGSVIEENYKWLMDRGWKNAFVKLIGSPEYVSYNGAVQAAHYGLGMNLGMQLGYSHAKMGIAMEKIPGYDAHAADKLQKAEQELKGATYPYLEHVAASRDLPLVEFKKAVLGVNSSPEAT